MVHKNVVDKPQASLSFVLQRPLSVHEFRDTCSHWFTQAVRHTGVDASQLHGLFHHDADGRPINTVSCYRFQVTGQIGHIVAVGEPSVDFLDRFARGLAKAPSAGLWPQAPKLHSQRIRMIPASDPHAYFAGDLVICRKAEQHKIWMAADKESRNAHIQDILKRGLERQLKALGVDFDVPTPQVEQLGHERAVPKLPSNPSANAFVRLASVAFTLPLELQGHWAAGALINRGYGRVMRLYRD